MEFALGARERGLRKAVSDFAVREIAPLVPKMEETGQYPDGIRLKLGKMGLLGLITPFKYGGSEMGHLAKVIAIEEISKVSAAIGVSLVAQYLCIWIINTFGTPEQKERYLAKLSSGEYVGAFALTEPSGGSDMGRMKTLAKRDGDVWKIDGKKAFITNSPIADVHIVIAKTDTGKERSPSVAFIVEKGVPGFSPGELEDKVGFRGLFTSKPVFEGCKVPQENMIASVGRGLEIALKAISGAGRVGMAAVCVGLCYASLEEGVKFAKGRVLYGKSISNLQSIQFLLAEIYALAEAARMLTYRAAWMLDKGVEAVGEVALAKYISAENALKCAKMGSEIHGGYGAILEYPIQRYLRDAMVAQFSGGTSQANRLTMARHIMRNF